MEGEQRDRRVAANEARFRAVNERIRELARSSGGTTNGGIDFVCECADARCTERIRLSPAEYEAVRAHPDRFAIRPGHELPGLESTVERGARFLVVEKTGEAGAVARACDPRA